MPTPTPTLPPLSGDTIPLNGSSLSFIAPVFVPGWLKTLGSTENGINRTFYDNAAKQLHITVEVDPPSGLTPLAHARALAAQFQEAHSSYHEFALGGGIDSGATWAWSYVSNGVTLYAIDWFRAFGPFDAAIEVYGPIADKPFIKALWRSIVDSAFTPAPYHQQSVQRQPLIRSSTSG